MTTKDARTRSLVNSFRSPSEWSLITAGKTLYIFGVGTMIWFPMKYMLGWPEVPLTNQLILCGVGLMVLGVSLILLAPLAADALAQRPLGWGRKDEISPRSADRRTRIPRDRSAEASQESSQDDGRTIMIGTSFDEIAAEASIAVKLEIDRQIQQLTPTMNQTLDNAAKALGEGTDALQAATRYIELYRLALLILVALCVAEGTFLALVILHR